MHLHHVQIAMPRGQEALARRFYAETLGLTELTRPTELAGRGGCWFQDLVDGVPTLEVHLGVEEPFAPAATAHPALLVDDVDALESLGRRIDDGGFEISWAERDSFAGYERFHCRDGFGNRIEVLAPAPDRPSTRRRPPSPAQDWSVVWRAGSPSAEHDPPLQWHWVTDDFVVLRQNKSVHFEAPFMFLVLGRERALLVDTGATAEPAVLPLRKVVDALIRSWWQDEVPTGYGLVVAHTHGHGDHRAADGRSPIGRPPRSSDPRCRRSSPTTGSTTGR